MLIRIIGLPDHRLQLHTVIVSASKVALINLLRTMDWFGVHSVVLVRTSWEVWFVPAL